MVKFIFETMTDCMTAYRSPTTGIVYDIAKGQPFNVKDKLDIKFFEKNTRFKKVGFFAKAKPDESDPEEDFKDSLLAIKDFGADTAELVVEIYRSEKELVEQISTGAPLEGTISKEEQEMLIKKYMPKELQHEESSEETKKEETPKEAPKEDPKPKEKSDEKTKTDKNEEDDK